MRAREFTTESFNSAYRYDWDKQAQDDWVGSFTTADRSEVRVQIYSDGGSYGYEISFDRGKNINPTGEGDAFKIFSTVLVMLRDFVAAVKPERFYFSSLKGECFGDAAGSRGKLYLRMCQRFAANSGYQLTHKSSDNYDAFVFNKI
jgi:hypothetical protein